MPAGPPPATQQRVVTGSGISSMLAQSIRQWEPPILIKSAEMKSLLLAILCAAVLAAAPLDQKGVEFAKPDGHPLLLDLHVPDGPGPFPAAILVHGGGFDGGNRATNMSPTFQPLADAGFAWV